jgi:hypothetical protein
MTSYLGTRPMLLQDGMINEAPRAITSSALAASSAGSDSSWTLTELAGAMMFAGAATTGAMLLGGPMEGLRGKTTCGGGTGGGGGGGGGGGKGTGGNAGGPIEEANKHSFDSSTKERDDQKKELGISTTTSSSGPYEVSLSFISIAHVCSATLF